MAESSRYDIPQHIKTALTEMGYPNPFSVMREHINAWADMLTSTGEFWDYTEREGSAQYRVHRRTIHPARRVCTEWASLLLNDKTQIVTESQEVTDWLDDWANRSGFWSKGQGLIADAFGLGTAAWGVWVDREEPSAKLRRYDARMVIPLTWDDDGVTECAFCTKAYHDGREIDQLQLHLKEESGYLIRTLMFDAESGDRILLEGVEDELQTNCETPTFAIVTPAIPNSRVAFSPYGQSVFADCTDVMQSVDLCYDAIFKEVDLAKMRVLMSDALFEIERKDGKVNYIPFGKADTTVFRKVSGSDDFIHEWAPSMRTESQSKAYRLAIQTMGDQCGFGSQYFDTDKSGGIKTATEVSSDNSALMRNIRKHENLLQASIAQAIRALLYCQRAYCGVSLPDEGDITVMFDDSIITDTAAEKAQDMSEVNITMNPWEYREKWYGEDEETAKANVPGSAEVNPAIFEA